LDALTSFDNALAFRADYLEAMNNRGNTLKEMGRLDEAIESYDRALAICPDAAETLNNRGVVLHALGRSDLALADHDRALALKPDYAEAFNNRGSCLLVFNRPVDALLDYDRALALKPDLAEAHENRGIVLTEIGYFDEANRAAERAASLAPRCARIYYNLVETRRVAPGDPWIPALQDMTRDSASLTVSEQIYLHFALGKALADIGEGAASFEHLLAGAALKRERTTYDEAATLSGLELTTTAFNDQLMRAGAGQGELSPVPVFIVGMPRSGSTLVEQILASHGDVFAAGEIEEFALAIKALGGDSGHLPHAHEAVDQISGDWRRLGEHYLSSIVAAAPEARRITNKTLDNFRFIGLIHLALPNARIIHMRRDPLDTCLSCFSKLFTGSLPYSYDLGELGRYYRAYHALMAHWRRVLPTDVMLDVDYEDVVADLEGQARSILAFCGLDWDPRCLDFHTTKRWVHTASATQVRQPIYQSSVGRWRPPEALLEPLISALG
jgi:lipoprotein NlpI